MTPQIPRRLSHQKTLKKPPARGFRYELEYAYLDLRASPELYRVGVGEQGVLLVEPYKSEILPHWRFKNPAEAKVSAREITALFRAYRAAKDFVGMDMARKFLQMGFTRARRYANHRSGRKYDSKGQERPREEDPVKAAAAAIFFAAWKKAEANPQYKKQKESWKKQFG